LIRGNPRGYEPVAFIERRIRALYDANPAVTDAQLISDIKADMTKVAAAITDILTNYNFGHHLNLTHVARAQPRFRYYHERNGWGSRDRGSPQARRRLLVRSIIWGAFIIQHSEQLHEPANRKKLQKLVDRRLHMVEIMRYHVGKAGTISVWNAASGARRRRPNRRWILSVTGGKPQWTDGHVLRWFEYPRVYNILRFRKAVEQWLEQLRGIDMAKFTAELGRWGVTRNPDGTYTWGVDAGDKWLTRDKEKIANHASAYWFNDPSNSYRWFLTVTGQTDPVAAIDKLFTPTIAYDPTQAYNRNNPEQGWKNWWERNHIYCDQTVHALHLRGCPIIP
jgi:hypothetical protein